METAQGQKPQHSPNGDEIRLAFQALNLAIRQVVQSIRCLTIAQLSMMSDERADAFEQLQEITGRLEEVETRVGEMQKLIDGEFRAN